jgi:hypothetical protein
MNAGVDDKCLVDMRPAKIIIMSTLSDFAVEQKHYFMCLLMW